MANLVIEADRRLLSVMMMDVRGAGMVGGSRRPGVNGRQEYSVRKQRQQGKQLGRSSPLT